MNILFLSQWFPFPANNGSKIRISQLLKGLSQVHQVTLFSFYDPKEPSFAQKESYPFCARVERVPWKPFNVTSRKATLGLFSLSPRSLLDTHSPEMEALISNAVSSGEFDLIIASQLTMASYFPVFGTLPAIFEEIELGRIYRSSLSERNFEQTAQAPVDLAQASTLLFAPARFVLGLYRSLRTGTSIGCQPFPAACAEN